MSVDWNSKQQSGKLHTTTPTKKLLIAVILVVLILGFAGGYVYAANFVNNSTNYSKPSSYNVDLVPTPIVLNGLFINWQGNSIYLNMTNTASTSVNATVTFYFYNGTSTVPFINSFNSILTPGLHPAQPYGNWPIQIKTLVIGSTIRVEV